MNNGEEWDPVNGESSEEIIDDQGGAKEWAKAEGATEIARKMGMSVIIE